jgi:hypothetical protein
LAAAARSSSEVVLLTAAAVRWLRTADKSLVEMAEKKLERLACGDRSYAMAKALRGTSTVTVFETKLDKGMRVLWTLLTHRAPTKAVLVWSISHHDSVSTNMSKIEASYARMRVPDAGAGAVERPSAVPDDVLLDPEGNTPLRIFEVAAAQVPLVCEGWAPPLRLTEREREIVEATGMSTVLGRSGTGKTFSVCSRMHLDRVRLPGARQLFVARTKRLCDYVQSLLRMRPASGGGGGDGDDGAAAFLPLSALLDSLGGSAQEWHPSLLSGYAQFLQAWPELRRGALATFERGTRHDIEAKAVGPLTAWTQIRSFIKGSHEAVLQGRALALEQYLALGKRRVPLPPAERQFVFQVFSVYQRGLDDVPGRWDACDRVTALYKRAVAAARAGAGPLYDLLYVDEVQDMTQGELALLLQLSGLRHDRLFLAGDTAQSISYGVDFRFDEVRSVVHALCGGAVAPKPLTLSQNYRSHAGVLDIAAKVVDVMHAAFPHAADVLPRDVGLAQGPRPELLRVDGAGRLGEVLRAAGRAKVIVHPNCDADSLGGDAGNATERRVRDACAAASIDAPLVLDVVQAKGLEFSEVIIVDFFADLPNQAAWAAILKREFLDSFSGLDPHALPHEVARDLKLLYTAVTRCCSRLAFVETRDSVAGSAWFRLLLDASLAVRYQPQIASEATRLTADEWRMQGIDLVNSADEEAPLPQLTKARECFARCQDAQLLARVDALIAQRKAVSGREFALAARLCIEAGMLEEAAALARLADRESPFIARLAQSLARAAARASARDRSTQSTPR